MDTPELDGQLAETRQNIRKLTGACQEFLCNAERSSHLARIANFLCLNLQEEEEKKSNIGNELRNHAASGTISHVRMRIAESQERVARCSDRLQASRQRLVARTQE